MTSCNSDVHQALTRLVLYQARRNTRGSSCRETRTVELSIPADPANLDSEAKVGHLSTLSAHAWGSVFLLQRRDVLGALRTTNFRGKTVSSLE